LRLARSLAGLLLGAACLPLTASSHGSLEQLIADLERLRVEHGVPGFGLTVASRHQGRRVGTGGVADRHSGRPVSPGTLFRIGSITKTFNALAIQMLVERGRIDLDTPLRTIIPDAPIENPWADEYPVRVVHLLEHSSGLLDITREEFDHNEPFSP